MLAGARSAGSEVIAADVALAAAEGMAVNLNGSAPMAVLAEAACGRTSLASWGSSGCVRIDGGELVTDCGRGGGE